VRAALNRLQALDVELASRAREAGRLRFEMGRGLDLLERTGGDHVLGFSSIEAYALERCERSASCTCLTAAMVRMQRCCSAWSPKQPAPCAASSRRP
jgi:hypothetical protein